jgi:NAD(P)-dependent dehydrogenase (short-subunit alcohol dehydrogenase family)
MASALITGANRGIGLELARQLKARGDTVTAVCRQSSVELDALGVRIERGIDVADARSIEQLRARVGDQPLDLLINNAGILHHESLGSLEFDAMLRQFEVNALGPLRVTEALLPRLGRGAKIALITSRMGSIADNGSGGAYGYRMSKSALNAAGVSLARDLAARGIAVVILHPGFVRTDMTGGNGMVEASESAAGLIARIDELTLENSGRFLHMNGEALPW